MIHSSGLVECRSDSEYAERPTALVWEGERLEITEILQRWRTPQEKQFLVRTRLHGLFMIAYSFQEDCWSIHQN
ncbi:MAG: hypothetical protein JW726_19815 [Anaerolineales bacterium]|nr:hypothetical protein [Anaerolineales bacterium]